MANGHRRLSAVGLMINNSIDKKRTSFPVGHSDRLMSLHLPLLGNQFMTIISVYAPTFQADPITKEQFYRELKSLHLKVDKADKLLIMGDVNARVGRDHIAWPGVLDHHRVGNCNDSGCMLLELCMEHSLLV